MIGMLETLYEDKDLLIINKPSGMVVHPYDHSDEETVIDLVQRTHPEIFSFENTKKLQDGRTINLGGLVHKLDRDTSGVLVFAKSEKVYTFLSELFKNHQVEKEYIALVEGIVEGEDFVIDAPLGRAKKDYKQSTDPNNQRGEMLEAITVVKVLEKREGATLLLLKPKTGRTHQLRAHMASIGHPIIGDKAYGSTRDCDRIMLHAKKIAFRIFEKDISVTVEEKDIF